MACEGISNSFDISTMDTNLVIANFKSNFYSRQGTFNFWVAVDNTDNVIGWQSLIKCFDHPFKENIYAESSTYVAKHNRFKGLGELLLNHVILEAKKNNIEYLVGFVATNNAAAKKITKATGWIEVGIIPTSSENKSNLTKSFLIRPL